MFTELLYRTIKIIGYAAICSATVYALSAASLTFVCLLGLLLGVMIVFGSWI